MGKAERPSTIRTISDYQNKKISLSYLAELSIESAKEIDNDSQGRPKGFNHIKELASILEAYQLRGDSPDPSLEAFPYDTLAKTLGEKSDKVIVSYAELAPEMRLFRSELEAIPNNSCNRKNIISLLCKLSDHLSLEKYISGHHSRRLAA